MRRLHGQAQGWEWRDAGLVPLAIVRNEVHAARFKRQRRMVSCLTQIRGRLGVSVG